MAENASKPKRRPRREPPSVLAALPSTRPGRFGTQRRGAPQHEQRRRPQAVRPASSPLRPKRRAKPAHEGLGLPTGTEFVTTTIRAAGELTKIGLTVGGQSLKGALRRLPRP
jgi:hypothetical protein